MKQKRTKTRTKDRFGLLLFLASFALIIFVLLMGIILYKKTGYLETNFQEWFGKDKWNADAHLYLAYAICGAHGLVLVLSLAAALFITIKKWNTKWAKKHSKAYGITLVVFNVLALACYGISYFWLLGAKAPILPNKLNLALPFAMFMFIWGTMLLSIALIFSFACGAKGSELSRHDSEDQKLPFPQNQVNQFNQFRYQEQNSNFYGFPDDEYNPYNSYLEF